MVVLPYTECGGVFYFVSVEERAVLPIFFPTSLFTSSFLLKEESVLYVRG